MKCLECDGKLTTKRENYRYLASGLANVTLMNVEVRRCGSCGDHEVVIPHIEALHKALAAAIVKRTSRMTGHEVKFLRKQLGYSGVDFATLIGVSAETISRWENGKERMRPSAEKLLRLLVVHQQPIRNYPLETLSRVLSDSAPKPIGLRVKNESWVEQALAAA
jgi:putative zinc finger/helix-turn-helix YgiT family protein